MCVHVCTWMLMSLAEYSKFNVQIYQNGNEFAELYESDWCLKLSEMDWAWAQQDLKVVSNHTHAHITQIMRKLTFHWHLIEWKMDQNVWHECIICLGLTFILNKISFRSFPSKKSVEMKRCLACLRPCGQCIVFSTTNSKYFFVPVDSIKAAQNKQVCAMCLTIDQH